MGKLKERGVDDNPIVVFTSGKAEYAGRRLATGETADPMRQ